MTSDCDRSQGLIQIAGSSAASFSPATGSVSNRAGTDSIGTAGGWGRTGAVAARAAGATNARARTSTDKRQQGDIGD